MPGPYPLATLAATVDESGISAPSLADVFASLQYEYWGIYGSDADLDPDGQDGQWLGVLAKKIDDANQMAILVYNQFSPATAIGTGLSSIVKTNAMKRQDSSASQVDVELVGQANATVTAGLVGDDQNLGTQWALPASVTIPPSGSITVQATSTSPGAVTAAPGTLTVILTPQPGWQTVTNSVAATLGEPVELDPALRLRQSISTALPATTPFDSIVAAVADVPGVVRVGGYQNDGATTDSNGVPPHAITIVAAGGSPQAIANAIAAKKPPGCPTYGTTSVVVLDAKGVPSTVNFYQLSSVTVSVLVFADALAGYATSTGNQLTASVAAYLSGLAIGGASYLGRLWAPADLSGTAATAATGLTQSALDDLSATYEANAIAQARPEMAVTAGGTSGSQSLTLASAIGASNLAAGKIVMAYLNDGSLFTGVVSGTIGPFVALANGSAIPAGKTLPDGNLLYVVGDVSMAFYEAASSTASAVNLTVTP